MTARRTSRGARKPARKSAPRSAAVRTTAPRSAAVRTTVPRRVERRMLLFVYGTLLVGERNHRVLGDAQLIGAARTRPTFQLHDLGGYPGLVPGGRHAVIGEVYEVDQATLADLDRLESHPRFYRRTSIVLVGGRRVQTYLLTREQVDGRPVIESGSWRARHSKEMS